MIQIALALLLGTAGISQPPRIARQQISALVNTIANYRTVVLRDTTPVDFCAVADFWGADGQFLAPEEAGRLLSVRNREQCAQMSGRKPVIVKSLEVIGDSLIASSVTTRGEYSILESYILYGMQGSNLCCGEYRAHQIIVSDTRRVPRP